MRDTQVHGAPCPLAQPEEPCAPGGPGVGRGLCRGRRLRQTTREQHLASDSPHPGAGGPAGWGWGGGLWQGQGRSTETQASLQLSALTPRPSDGPPWAGGGPVLALGWASKFLEPQAAFQPLLCRWRTIHEQNQSWALLAPPSLSSAALSWKQSPNRGV